VTLPLPAESFDRAREVVVVVAGYRVRVRVLERPAPASSPFEWVEVIDCETGMAALPSQVRALQIDADYRCRVNRAAYSTAAWRR